MLGIGIGCILLLMLGCNLWVVQSTRHQVYQQLSEVPVTPVALLLGTSRYTRGNRENLYFKYRIVAAAELYHSGKVKHLIVSGDNSDRYYNEPVQMQKALLEKGVPAHAMTLDYAGFRTLDSVVRCWKVFGQEEFLVISQGFHTPRALFIANHYDLQTQAFNARKVTDRRNSILLREWLARCKAVLDLYILRKGPKFLGEEISIPVD